MFEKCPNFNYNVVEEIHHDGYFTFYESKYLIRTKYLKCTNCGTEYMGQDQYRENQQYIKSIKV